MAREPGLEVANADADVGAQAFDSDAALGDLEKLFTMWDEWSWHRVTCYGDLKAPVEEYAKARKLPVITEA